MSNFRNVSKTAPCPICGKPDWCTVQFVEGGDRLHYCRRISYDGELVSPVTGETYVFIKQTKEGSCMYKEKSAYQRSREEWLRNNGKQDFRASSKKTAGAASHDSAWASSTPKPSDLADQVIPLDNRTLDRIYRRFLRLLPLQKNHIAYLRGERWPESLIHKSLIRSLPPAGSTRQRGNTREIITCRLMEEFGSLKGVPGFYEGAKGNWTFAGSSGILIPLYDHNGNLFRLRIRLDRPEKDENGKEKNKYHNFSSYYEIEDPKGGLKNAFKDGCRSGSHRGIYCDPERDDFSVCYITEGEKKSIYANHTFHNPVVSIPGVNSFSKILEKGDDGYHVLEFLRGKGCRTLIIAYDADKHVNKAVLMYERKLAELLAEKGFQIAFAYWNPGFGKGLDDILSINVRPNYELYTKETAGVA